MVEPVAVLGRRGVVRDDREVRTTVTAAAVTAAAVLVALVGCADPQPAGTSRPDAADLELSGPWADVFAEALDESESAVEREILADGVVTSTELEQAHDGVRRCLADSGLAVDYSPDGGFELTDLDGDAPDMPFERSDAALQACETRFDSWVTFLFEQVRRNPERLDEGTIQVRCLADAGLVDPSYGRDDWEADDESGTFPFDTQSEAAQSCLRDPLGLWSGR
jgi:hypothetical protein